MRVNLTDVRVQLRVFAIFVVTGVMSAISAQDTPDYYRSALLVPDSFF